MQRPRYVVPLLLASALFASNDRLAAQAPQTGTIAGRVMDSTTRQPVSSANVVVDGTTRGALTRNDGTYSLVGVPAGTHRVRVSRIGYAPQQQDVNVVAGGTATADFTLLAAATRFSEVVVVGYGTQRREAVTGSVATVNAEEANVGLVTAPTQMVQGRVAGVQVTQNDGGPGAGVQIRIRGGTSISASNEPLYVIDGVPINNTAIEPTSLGQNNSLPRNPLTLINPNDIESITVLKDASATAIYGSRGANGVVLVSTKRGREGRVEVAYDGMVSSSSPSRRLDVLTGTEYRAFIQSQVDLYVADSLAGVATANRRGLAPNRLTNLGSSNTDWEDEVLRNNALTYNHNLSFSGGAAGTQYRGSLSYLNQEGVVRSSGLERLSGRVNANQQAFSNRLRLGLNLNASQVKNDYVPFENTGGFTGTVFTNMLIMNPTQPVMTTDATTGARRFYEIGTGAVTIRNPVAIAEQIKDDGVSRRTLGNVTADYDLLPSLTAQLNLATDRSNGVRSAYYPKVSPLGAVQNGEALIGNIDNVTNTLQTYLTYRASAAASDFELLGGYEFNKYSTVTGQASAQSFISDALGYYNLGAGAILQVPASNRVDSRLISFFGRANYSFADRYFLTGVLRRDGSSRFGSGNQWGLFPAISGAWLVSAESFMQDRLFSELRLKAGYGINGSQEIPAYSALLTLAPGARASFGEQTVIGYFPNRNPNPDLKWEETAQWNVGVDYGFAANRFTGTVEYYTKDTRDLLLTVTVPQPAPVVDRLDNIGKVRNRGLEFSFDAQTIQRPRLDLSLGIVGSVERNRVVSLGKALFFTTGSVSGQGQSGQVSQRILPGQPLGTFFGPQYLGVDAQGKQLFRCRTERATCVDGQTVTPIAADYTILGNANPDFSLGGRGALRVGALDASFLVRGVFGPDVFNNGALVYSTKGNALQDKNFLRAALNDPIGLREPAIFSDRWIEDGSFVRLQNVTVGFTFNTLPGLGERFRGTRVFLSGDNLLLLTDYSGYDPEVHTDAGLASRGIDYLHYPNPRTLTFGARLGF